MTAKKMIGGALGLALFMAAGGCQDPNERPAEWESIHAAIIAPSCATSSCHSSLAKAAGVVLEDVDESYAFLIAENFITPGDVDQSFLMPLLLGEDRVFMPPDAPLPKADVDLIRIWIEEGAQR